MDERTGAIDDILKAIDSDEVDGDATYRVVTGIGARRAEALSAEGRDSTHVFEDEQALARWVDDRLAAHDHGPVSHMYLVLRRGGKSGNVAVSRPMPVGNRSAENELSITQNQATSVIFGTHQKIVADYGEWARTALQLAFQALHVERNTAVDLEAAVAAAENSRNAGRSETAAALIEAVKPVVAGFAAKGGGGDPTPESVVATFNGWSDSTKSALIAALGDAIQKSGGSQ